MPTLLRRALRATVLSGGILIAGAAAAQADDGLLGDEPDGGGLIEDVVSDVTATIPVTVPVDVGDVTATVLGETTIDSDETPAPADPAPTSTVEVLQEPEDPAGALPDEADESVALDIAADDTATLPITAPVTAGDPVVNVGGETDVGPAEAAPAAEAPTSTTTVTTAEPEADAEPVVHEGPELTDGLVEDVVADTTVTAPVTAPVDVGDVTLNVLGETTIDRTEAPAPAQQAPVATTAVDTTDGTDGTGNGTGNGGLIDDVISDLTATAPVTLLISLGDITLNVLGETEIIEEITPPVTDPTDPVDPVDPTDPTDPVDPTDPSDQMDPSNVTDPMTDGRTVPVVLETSTDTAAQSSAGTASAGTPVQELPETGAGASLPLAALAGVLVLAGLVTRRFARA